MNASGGPSVSLLGTDIILSSWVGKMRFLFHLFHVKRGGGICHVGHKFLTHSLGMDQKNSKSLGVVFCFFGIFFWGHKKKCHGSFFGGFRLVIIFFGSFSPGTEMAVSKNNGIPKSSILIGVFHYFHHPFWGVFPLFLETPKWIFPTFFWGGSHPQKKRRHTAAITGPF